MLTKYPQVYEYSGNLSKLLSASGKHTRRNRHTAPMVGDKTTKNLMRVRGKTYDILNSYRY
jgi:hypothetical protein